MKTGWIKFEDELPPIDLPIVISFQNIAYGLLRMYFLGKRINEDSVMLINYDGELKCKMSVYKTDDIMKHPYATHWAYNTEQKLSEIID